MKLISRKKHPYGISQPFHEYLVKFGRAVKLPLDYKDLLRFSTSIAHYDKDGKDTLWSTVSYDPSDRRDIHNALLEIYAILRAEGDRSAMDHLIVDRIDLCLYGNTKPFRIRIINSLNENFDYFYVKQADASRVFGLELEHVLSPNRIGFFVWQDTLIEDHIYGIPGDMFIEKYMDHNLNEVRLAKEFVKFNERCFLRLLGDMHTSNFVVDITVDFEENMYRIRSLDFDQQSHEPRLKVYLPQYFKENNPFVNLGMKHLTWETVRQYQKEERALIHKRMMSSHFRLSHLLSIMESETLAPAQNVEQLREELSIHYNDEAFLRCKTMGQLVKTSLERLNPMGSPALKKPSLGF